MRLSRLTGGKHVGSNFAGRFLFSRWAKGSAVETSPYYDRGVRDGIEAGAGVGADGRDVPARDLRDGGGVSCFLKLDIFEGKKTKISSKTKIAENTKIADCDNHTHLKWSIDELHCNPG